MSGAKLGGDRSKFGVGGHSDLAKGGFKLGDCESTKFGCCPDGSTRI